VPAAVSVIVLGYGSEEFLEQALTAAVAQLGDGDEVVLVDNGVDRGAERRPSWPAVVRVIAPGTNTGFAGGCRVGVEAASGEVLVFVNSDAIVRPGAVSRLVTALEDPTVGIAGGCLRLADRPGLVNSVGNPLHYSGITWAGSCGEPAELHQVGKDVAVATGGLFAMRRDTWNALDGFDASYFAYHEDTDLCVRAWLSGRRVTYVPDAVADHHYEFGRSPLKMYLVERNRLVTVLTDYPEHLLRRVLPALVVIEPLLLAQALMQGWGRQKVASWGWLVRHRTTLAERRRLIQSSVTTPQALDSLLITRIEPSMVTPPPGMGLVNAALSAYWRLVGPKRRP
jgi:GT2 family glycosyltransferase